MPAQCAIASHPENATRSSSALERSLVIKLMRGEFRMLKSLRSIPRAIKTRLCPSAANARARCRPTKPVPPVIAIFISGLLYQSVRLDQPCQQCRHGKAERVEYSVAARHPGNGDPREPQIVTNNGDCRPA